MVDGSKNTTANIALFIIQIVSAVSGFVISASCLFLRKWHPPIAYTAAFHISFWIGVQAIITHMGSAISVRLPDAGQDMQNSKPLIRFLIWAQFAMPLWFVFLNVAIATDLMFSQLFRLNITKLQSMHRWYLPVATLMAFTLALPLLIYHSEYHPLANVFSVQFPSALSVTLYYILAFDVWIAIGIVYCFVVVSLVVSIIVMKLRKKRAAWNEHNLAQLEGNVAPPRSIQIPKRIHFPVRERQHPDSSSMTDDTEKQPTASHTPSLSSPADHCNTKLQAQSGSNNTLEVDKNPIGSGESGYSPRVTNSEETKVLTSTHDDGSNIFNRKSVLFITAHDSSDELQALGRKEPMVQTKRAGKRKDLHISGATTIGDGLDREHEMEQSPKIWQLSGSATLRELGTGITACRRRTALWLANLPPPFTLHSNHRSVLVCTPGASSPFRIPTLALVRLLLYPLIPIFSFTLMVIVRWVWFRSNMPSRWEVLNVVSGFLRALEGFLCLIVFLLNPALNRSFREIRKRNTPVFSQ